LKRSLRLLEIALDDFGILTRSGRAGRNSEAYSAIFACEAAD
jgi:hypothetical protein